jgi:hypothetical protein
MWEVDAPNENAGWGTLQELEKRLGLIGAK